MNDYPVKQIKPNHAEHISNYNEKFLTKLFEENYCIAQPKYDGERMLIHIVDGKIYCTSRRISKKTERFMENQDRLPVLQQICDKRPELQSLGYTVIDCECYADNWSEAASVLHSLPARAVELQKTIKIRFAVFDCLWYDGVDLTESNYSERSTYAEDVVNFFDYNMLHFVDIMSYDVFENKFVIRKFGTAGATRITNDNWKAAMQVALDNGFEGIVVKSLDLRYYDKAALLKCKKFETVDVVVYDYVPGKGKYTGTVGALKVGYFDPETTNTVHISNVNCSTDAERDAWRDNWLAWKYTVIEILCQEVTDRSLRHPRYVRRREDKDYKMCTKDTIFK